MTEQEVRRYLRQMKEEDSERAFHSFYNLCYDRLFRIACYFVKHEEWAQEIVLDVFMKALGTTRPVAGSEQHRGLLLYPYQKRLPQLPGKREPTPYTLVRTGFPNFPARPILPKTLLSAKNCLPDMSRRSTACRSVAVKYSSACAKRNKAMHKWRRI